MTLDPERDLHFSRVLDAPRDTLWACWTTPEHIKAFFIPKPHSVVSCDIALRVGGRFNTTFDIDGAIIENAGVFLDVVEGQRLVFTDAFTEGWKPAADPFLTAIITFEDAPEGGTVYTATARHRSKEARKQHEDMGFFEGWGIVATQLEAHARSLD